MIAKTGLIITLAVVMLMGCNKEPLSTRAARADYFPLEIGNQWVYRAIGPSSDSGKVTLSVLATNMLEGRRYYVVALRHAGRADTTYWREDASGRLYQYLGTGLEALFLDPGRHVGDEWSAIDDTTVSNTVSIGQIGDTVTVPAGTFTATIEIGINQRLGNSCYSSCVLAENVGPILSRCSGWGPITGDIQLESAVVGGKSY